MRSTDATWHPRDWELTSLAVDTYFADDWQSVRAFGLMLHGREALRAFMKDWLGRFPDVYASPPLANEFEQGGSHTAQKRSRHAWPRSHADARRYHRSDDPIYIYHGEGERQTDRQTRDRQTDR